jgi:ankyrin repeat protein
MDLFNAAINGNMRRIRELLDSDSGQTILRLLLENGVDPNIRDNNGSTALISASHRGYSDIIRLLLENDADINITDNNGFTALILASRNGHTEIVRLLLENDADPNITDNSGVTALIKASYEGHTEIVRLLLENDADINITDNNGVTALISASHEGHTEIVELLLEYDADPNISEHNGVTALFWATDLGHTEIVRLLLENDADPNIKTKNGATFLIRMASRNGHDDIVRLIQDHINLQKAKQNLAFATSFNSRLGNDTAIDDLDIDTIRKFVNIPQTYNPSVNTRMRDEVRREGLEIGENAMMADYLDTLNQYGSGKHSKKRSGKRRKNYTRRRL